MADISPGERERCARLTWHTASRYVVVSGMFHRRRRCRTWGLFRVDGICVPFSDGAEVRKGCKERFGVADICSQGHLKLHEKIMLTTRPCNSCCVVLRYERLGMTSGAETADGWVSQTAASV